MKHSIFTLVALATLLISIPQQTFAQNDDWEKLALTPPMGWNSWNTFRLGINEDLVKEIADVFVEKGLKDAGYEYIVMDDGWQISRCPPVCKMGR